MSWFQSAAYIQAAGIHAQNKLLNHFVKCKYESKQSKHLNYIDISRKSNSIGKERVLVLLHGYGLGLGFYFDNYDGLTNNFDRIISVDWLGMGCSSRVAKFIPRTNWISSLIMGRSAKQEDILLQKSNEAINELIDSLEDFRKSENLDNFVLAGHSLGGFLVAKYALKYPTAVKSLVLISPVGVPNHPPKGVQHNPLELDYRVRMFDTLWQMNVTPQDVIRWTGRRGVTMVTEFMNRRFTSRRNDEELKIISDYFYQITVAPGNGEYCLNAILQPIFVKTSEIEEKDTKLGRVRRAVGTGIYARQPLEDELSKLNKIPILLLFGDNDWLYFAKADECVQKWRKNGVDAEMIIIPNAGHHLYLDNSVIFNKVINDWSNKYCP